MARKLRQFSPARVIAKMEALGLNIQQLTGRMMTAGHPKITPNHQHVSQILAGKTKQPGVDYIFLFAHALGCTAEDLSEVVK